MRSLVRASLFAAALVVGLASVTDVDAAPKPIVATPVLAPAPNGAAAQDARVRKLLATSAKTKVAALEKKIAAKRYDKEDAAAVLADARGATVEQFGNVDVDAILFIVMLPPRRTPRPI